MERIKNMLALEAPKIFEKKVKVDKMKILCPNCKKAMLTTGWAPGIMECPKCGWTVEVGDE